MTELRLGCEVNASPPENVIPSARHPRTPSLRIHNKNLNLYLSVTNCLYATGCLYTASLKVVEFNMSEPSVIHCKVTSIHPFFDPFGNEFVCIDFGVEVQRPPSVMSMPTGTPPEMSFIMPILSQLPKMLPQARLYSNRLVLFLTTQEWERMTHKYQYGDEVELRVNRDGTIQLFRV